VLPGRAGYFAYPEPDLSADSGHHSEVVDPAAAVVGSGGHSEGVLSRQAEDARGCEASQSATGGFAAEETGGLGHRTDRRRPAPRPAALAHPAANLGGAG